MMEPVFSRNSEANFFHVRGLECETELRDYEQAHHHFDLALGVLSLGGSEKVNHDIVSYARELQRARITRDDGFTYVRQALSIQPSDQDYLYKAHETLVKAEGLSRWLVEKGRHEFRREQWQELSAEHGATISLLGRLATVAEVVGIPLKDIYGPEEYYRAHDEFLRHGSNRYYEASNALNAARHERLHSRLIKTGYWLGRAALSTRRASSSDPENYQAAVDTIAKRRPALLTKSRVKASVLAHP